MKAVLVIALVLAATASAKPSMGNARKFGPYKNIGGRIIGGQLAEPDQFPWQVGIFASTEMGDIFCGGSLISDQWVLTAGHCAEEVYEYQIQLGSNSLGELDDNRVTVYTDEYVQHENYSDFDGIHDDVAVIKLQEPVEFNEHIQPVALHEGEPIGAGVSVTISGFGKIRDNGTLSNLLNWIELTTITNDECSKAYSDSEIAEGFVCASGKSGQNTCSGDSGGPLVTYDEDGKATEVGIVSFGHRDGCLLAPSGYTRVQYYREWIKEQTGL